MKRALPLLLLLLIPTAACLARFGDEEEEAPRGAGGGGGAPGCGSDEACDVGAYCVDGACCLQDCTNAICGELRCGHRCPGACDPRWVSLGPGPEGCGTDAWPSARDSAVLTERADGSLLLFGGDAREAGTGFVALDDLWSLRATEGGVRWERLVAEPPARYGHAMVELGPSVCAAHGRPSGCVLIFGGKRNPTTYLGDAWLWHEEGGFTSYEGDTPSPRGQLSAAREPGGDAALLFGGFGPVEGAPATRWAALDELWRFDERGFVLEPKPDGATWPAARGRAGLVPHPTRGGLLLYGGTHAAFSGGFADTYRFDRGAFSELGGDPSRGPGPIGLFAFAWDPVAGAAVLFGGRNEGVMSSVVPTGKLHATWELGEAGTWRELFPKDAPSSRDYVAGAWLPGEGFVTFGGCLDEEPDDCNLQSCELYVLRR